jgi:hypothetical protein
MTQLRRANINLARVCDTPPGMRVKIQMTFPGFKDDFDSPAQAVDPQDVGEIHIIGAGR